MINMLISIDKSSKSTTEAILYAVFTKAYK